MNYKSGIFFWLGAGVYSLINIFMNAKQVDQSLVLTYNYEIAGVAVLGFILNAVLLKRSGRKKR